MIVVLLWIIGQFGTQYRDFVNSSNSEDIFIQLTRDNNKITEYANDPVVLWFWRSNSGSAEADSLLKKVYLKRNYQLSAVLRWEAKEAPDVNAALNKLQLAVHLDSSAIENTLSLLALGVKTRNLEYITTALSLPVLSDFRSQLFMIVNLGILAFSVIFLCTVIYILVKSIYYLPVLSHRLGPKKPARVIDIAKALIILIPVLIIRNIYLIFVCYSCLIILVVTVKEKNWLRICLFGLVLAFILFLPVNNFISFLKNGDDNYKLYEMVNYDSFSHLEVNTNKEKELLAYGLKQQGYYDEALTLYEDLYYKGNRNNAIANNLANIYFIYNEPTLAESLYNVAISLENRGEPFFNLGLLKLKKLEFLESSWYMEEARKRKFSSPLEEPVDIKPTNRDFYEIILSDKIRYNGIFDKIYVLPIILIIILTFLPIKLEQPFFCTSCGRPLCQRCLKEINEETLCQDCFTKFKSTKHPEIEEELRKSVLRSKTKVRNIILYTLNILIPGAGLIYLKKHMIGLMIVSMVLTGYVPILFPKIFVKPTGWIALSSGPVFTTIAVVFALISYSVSFLLIKGQHAD